MFRDLLAFSPESPFLAEEWTVGYGSSKGLSMESQSTTL
jgi:hypothetical protein